jgi:hypothetical protein
MLRKIVEHLPKVADHLRRATEHLRENRIWPYLFRVTQVGSLLLFLRWWWHIPPPGYAVGVLAVLAAVMSLHIEAKMQSWEKSLWMLLMGSFLVLEFKAIRQDRTEQDSKHQTELAAQAEKNKETIETILRTHNEAMAQNQKQFIDTVSKMNGLADKSEKNIDLAAGISQRSERTLTGVEGLLTPLDEITMDVIFQIDCNSQKYRPYCEAGFKKLGSDRSPNAHFTRHLINNWTDFPDIAETTLELNLDVYSNQKDSDRFLAGEYRDKGNLSLRFLDSLAHSDTILSYPVSPTLFLLSVSHAKPVEMNNNGIQSMATISGLTTILTDDKDELKFLTPWSAKLTNKKGQSLEARRPFEKLIWVRVGDRITAYRLVFQPRKGTY